MASENGSRKQIWPTKSYGLFFPRKGGGHDPCPLGRDRVLHGRRLRSLLTLVATPLQLKKPVSGATCLRNSSCVFVFKDTLGARHFSCAVYGFGQDTSAALHHQTREKSSGTQCSLRVKNVTIRHRVIMLTKNSSTKIRRND